MNQVLPDQEPDLDSNLVNVNIEPVGKMQVHKINLSEKTD